MAETLAELDIELDNHVIHGLGLPTKLGDVTRVDTTFVPLAASGAGSPGASFEAAAKDHVHPLVAGEAGPGVLSMEYAGALKVLQPDNMKHEALFEAWRNFDGLGGEGHEMKVTLWADMQREGIPAGGPGGAITVAIGATAGDPMSGDYAGTASTDSDTVARATGTATVPQPKGWQLCRVIGTGGFRGKNFRVEFEGV